MNESLQVKTARPWLRWFLVTALAIGVSMAGAITLAVRDRLALADWALTEGAIYFGFPEATFKFAALEKNHLQINRINMGDELSVKSVRVSYTPETLLNGRIDRVEISGLKLDATRLDSGVLGKIQKLIANNSGKPQSGTPTPLPTVSLQDANVYGQQAGVDFNVQLGAEMNPDQSGTFKAGGRMQFTQSGHQLKADEIKVGGEFNTATKSVKLKFNNIVLSDTTKDIWFSPLTVTGDVQFDGRDAQYDVVVKDTKQRTLSTIKGSFSPAPMRANAKVQIPGLTFSRNGLQPHHISPLARLPYPFDGTVSGLVNIGWQDGKLQTRSDIYLKTAGVIIDKTSVKDVSAKITAHWPDTDNKATLSLNLANARVNHDGLPLEINPVMAKIQVDPLSRTIAYTIMSADIQHMTDPPWITPLNVQAEGLLIPGTVTFTAKVSDRQKTVQLLNLKGKHTLANGEGSADVSVGPFAFTPGILQPSKLAPQLELLQEVSGGVSAQSKLFWSKAGLKGVVETKLDQLSFQTDTISVDGLQARILMSEIWPPRTMGPQLIRAENITTAATLSNPQISFSIRPGDAASSPRLILHHIKSGIVGGQMFIRGMTIDPDAATHSFDLYLQDLELEQVFSLIELEGVTGSGKLSGTIPLSIRDDDVVITDARLTSVSPGILRFQSEQAKQALGGGGEQVELLLRVLTDFRYNELSLGIGRQSGGAASIALHLKGHNPAVMDGNPFNLNINLEGNVDRLLGVVLEGYRLSDRAIRATLKPR